MIIIALYPRKYNLTTEIRIEESRSILFTQAMTIPLPQLLTQERSSVNTNSLCLSVQKSRVSIEDRRDNFTGFLLSFIFGHRLLYRTVGVFMVRVPEPNKISVRVPEISGREEAEPNPNRKLSGTR